MWHAVIHPRAVLRAACYELCTFQSKSAMSSPSISKSLRTARVKGTALAGGLDLVCRRVQHATRYTVEKKTNLVWAGCCCSLQLNHAVDSIQHLSSPAAITDSALPSTFKRSHCSFEALSSIMALTLTARTGSSEEQFLVLLCLLTCTITVTL